MKKGKKAKVETKRQKAYYFAYLADAGMRHMDLIKYIKQVVDVGTSSQYSLSRNVRIRETNLVSKRETCSMLPSRTPYASRDAKYD